MRASPPHVVAVSRSARHSLGKDAQASVWLVAGLGVEGDAHQGATVKHRSRVRRDPSQPNLRQVHLIHAELLDELAAVGFVIAPGQVGENVLTRGLELLALSRGSRLRLGREALVEFTGLRNPCSQLDGFQPGLMSAVLSRGPNGQLIRRAGVMAIVLEGGEVRPGDAVAVEFSPAPHIPLDAV